jgi:hypothetical protein
MVSTEGKDYLGKYFTGDEAFNIAGQLIVEAYLSVDHPPYGNFRLIEPQFNVSRNSEITDLLWWANDDGCHLRTAYVDIDQVDVARCSYLRYSSVQFVHELECYSALSMGTSSLRIPEIKF